MDFKKFLHKKQVQWWWLDERHPLIIIHIPQDPSCNHKDRILCFLCVNKRMCQTLMNLYIEINQYKLGFVVFSPCRPCWLGLWDLSQRKIWSLLEEQRSGRRLKQNPLNEPRGLCCVLPLLAEISERLLPPFEMIMSSSKKLLWSAKGACNGCSFSKIRMAQVTSQYHVPSALYACLFISKSTPYTNPNRATP